MAIYTVCMSDQTPLTDRPREDEVTIPQAAALLGRNANYIRQMVAKERPDGGGKELSSRLWMGVRLIKKSDLEDYRQRKQTRGRKAGYAGPPPDAETAQTREYQRQYMREYRQGKKRTPSSE